jgi:hypothetical protein
MLSPFMQNDINSGANMHRVWQFLTSGDTFNIQSSIVNQYK